jgi:two-component system alkaline phosphatase synthesis response regulator PhoP
MEAPRQILIVDDDPAAVELIQYMLQREGYETSLAVTGAAGLTMAREERPDLILLDVMLPEMDGLEACRRLRADASISHIPIIMLSARAQSSDLKSGREVGADLYLTKPIDLTALSDEISRLLKVG